MFLDQTIKKALNSLPDSKSPGPQDIAARNIIVIKHPRPLNDLGIPLGEIIFFFSINTE